MPRIHSPAISRRIVIDISVGFFLVGTPLFSSASNIQAHEVRTITVDKLTSAQPPNKENPDRLLKDTVGPKTPSPAMFCYLGFFLVLDAVKQVRIVAINGPLNSTVNFTTVQTNAGVLGVCHSGPGRFAASIVPLDGNGNGQREIFYLEGLQPRRHCPLETSVKIGNTSVLDYPVLPRCYYLPIPSVPWKEFWS